MQKIGDIARAKDVGVGGGFHKCVWHGCIQCGQPRWVLLRNGQPQSQRCYPCGRNYEGRIKTVRRGKDHWRWNGGRSVTTGGYVEIWLDPASPFYGMTSDGYIYEHRFVMAKKLGRSLFRSEEVHHLNGIKHDNRLENLQLMGSKSDHAAEPWRQIKRLEKEVAELKRKLHEATKGA